MKLPVKMQVHPRFGDAPWVEVIDADNALIATVHQKHAQDLGEILDAAVKLIAKLDAVHHSKEYTGIFMAASVHGIVYRGPSYDAEMERLRAALTKGEKVGERGVLSAKC